ncbi:DUF6232 family protein [Actinoplanes sp. CA-142083]|uniref:DUF6232 family protein n=1 Tax=Actinoplanes sp. CA-142083 TaxID=3239903 RepID=UPI003D8EBB28
MSTSSASRSKPLWRVLYEGAEITVTTWHVEVDGLRIAIPELRGMTRCLTYRYPMVKVAAVTAGLELAIAAPFAVAYGSALMVCAGLVSACGVAFGVIGDAQRNPRYQEIHAVIRGQRVVLYGTRDHQQFGFVWRALIRAVEANRDLYPYD